MHELLCCCHLLQRSTLDVIAISLGIVVTLRPAAAELTTARPPQVLNQRETHAKVVAGLLVVSTMYAAVGTYLKHQAWYLSVVSNSQVSNFHDTCSVLIWHSAVANDCSDPYLEDAGLRFCIACQVTCQSP